MTKLSDAYRELADSFLRAAAAIDEAIGDDLPDIPDTQSQALQPLPAQQKPQVYVPQEPQQLHGNAATHCPIHGDEYRQGNFGPYCPKQGAEPYADRKGFCSMPGRNNANALQYVAALQSLQK